MPERFIGQKGTWKYGKPAIDSEEEQIKTVKKIRLPIKKLIKNKLLNERCKQSGSICDRCWT